MNAPRNSESTSGISQASVQFCRDTLDPSGVREFDPPRCVVLDRGDEALGLTLVGASGPGVFIMAIAAGKLADRDGRLQAKDRVLEINGHNTIHATHQDAVALSSAPGVVTLVVAARNPLAKRRRTGTGSNGDMREQARRAREAGAARRRQQQQQQEEDAALAEDPSERALTAATTETPTAATPPAGPNTDVGAVTLPIGADTTQTTRGPVERIVLTKGPEGIGMLLAGGQGTPFGATFIRAIVAGKAAARDGRLCVGDRVLEVDGHRLDGVSHHDTVRIMQQSQTAIALEVQHLGQEQWEALVHTAEGQVGAEGVATGASPPPKSASPPTSPVVADVVREAPILRPPSSSSITSKDPLIISLQRSAEGYGFKVCLRDVTRQKAAHFSHPTVCTACFVLRPPSDVAVTYCHGDGRRMHVARWVVLCSIDVMSAGLACRSRAGLTRTRNPMYERWLPAASPTCVGCTKGTDWR